MQRLPSNFTETDNLDQIESQTQKICKICLMPNQIISTDSDLKIFTVIKSGYNSSYCRCRQFVHEECLVNWCILKSILQCPDCNIIYNLEIRKLVDEENYSYIFIIRTIIFLFVNFSFFIVSVIFFTSTQLFTQINQHWNLLLGILFLIMFTTHTIYGIINRKKIFSQEKQYVFQIKLLPENMSEEKIHKISTEFNFLLKTILGISRGELFSMKVDTSIFLKIENQKKSNLFTATLPYSNKKSKISREVSVNCFIQINEDQNIGSVDVGLLRRGSIISDKLVRNKPINNLHQRLDSLNARNNFRSPSNLLKNPAYPEFDQRGKRLSITLLKNKFNLSGYEGNNKFGYNQTRENFLNAKTNTVNENMLVANSTNDQQVFIPEKDNKSVANSPEKQNLDLSMKKHMKFEEVVSDRPISLVSPLKLNNEKKELDREKGRKMNRYQTRVKQKGY